MSVIDELEAAIAAAPDEVTSYQVLADALIEAGDPAGELIARHLRLQTSDHSSIDAGSLFAQLEAQVFGRPTPEGLTVGWRWGFVHELRIDASLIDLAEVLRTFT